MVVSGTGVGDPGGCGVGVGRFGVGCGVTGMGVDGMGVGSGGAGVGGMGVGMGGTGVGGMGIGLALAVVDCAIQFCKSRLRSDIFIWPEPVKLAFA